MERINTVNLMKTIGIIVIFCFLATNRDLFASEVIKKEAKIFVEHATTDVTGVCKEINFEKFEILPQGKSYKLKSPFQITIPVTKIDSGDEDRDEHIQEILGHPEHALIYIKVESILPNDQNYIIKGKLTIHGRTKDFESIAKVENKEKNIISTIGELEVTFSAYQLENPSLLFLKAKDQIKIKYNFDIKIK
ncbi:YceI-like domain protein [Leptospira ryugenii]|uniref:YceI-like domain protein n=1 Tax=Leptospira ryugenii TaxID=1917863 RepID=A0A2P2E2L3_9LEPT|nr:YceI family protein [Leptospira ryugenii]GBF51143.1 YceI-like domain protein [Leptospira ryugenii]